MQFETASQKENMPPTASSLPLSSLSKTRISSMPQLSKLLHFGENEHDLFLVQPEDSARLLLLEKVKADPSSPDVWLQLVKGPLSYEVKTYRKMRLFRRAFTCIDKVAFGARPSYTELWVLFAKLQEDEKDTRSTFSRMKKEHIGENSPLFYEEMAAFEYRLGNVFEAEEILERGVDNGVLAAVEKEDLYRRIIVGKAGNATPFSEPPHVEPLQTPRDALKQLDVTTPRGQNSSRSSVALDTTPITTPVGFARSGTSTSGFSTVSKFPRTENKASVLATPSLPARPTLKSQSTSRKTQHTASRFRTLGGPPLRVMASTDLNDDKDSDDDDDDDMMLVSPKEEHKPLSPVKETAIKTEKQKLPTGDFSYITSWRPRGASSSVGKSIGQMTNKDVIGTASTSSTSVARRPSENSMGSAGAANGLANSDTSRAHDRYPSPKRQQLDPGVLSVRNHADLSPHSPSSVSSASSPPLVSVSSSTQDPFASLSSKVVVNGLRYIKLEQIGSGGSSKVYRMLGPDLKIYALKKIKLKRLDEQSIAQYTNEIELLRRLQGNPHIIKLVAAEQDLQQRQINVIMEHGEIDLSERLRDLKDGLDENFLRVIWTQMLQAVDAIHSERIIHGDLKPANFLFVNGALKLIDFGIAKAISNDTTNIERDSQVGTVNFMSPEAIQGNAAPNGQRNPQGKMKVGRASDIWSLGCILYQIVYSKPPFADVRSIIEKFRCIIDPSVPIPFPALKNKDLEDVIRSCLQRDHRARPSINGEHGLLNHPFLRSGGVNAIVSPATTVTMANAPQVLSQLGELLRSQGVESSRVQSFLSIGQEGLRASNGIPRTRGYLYNTEERRTDI